MVIDQDNYRGGPEIPELKRFRGERALITEELNIVGRLHNIQSNKM